jgi:5,10-methenyltetrahydrofolate synthetase
MADPSGDQDFDSASFRARQRREKIAARQAMTDTEHARASLAIESYLAELLAGQTPRRIGFCWPLRNEFDCRPLVTYLTGAGWRACQPVVVAVAAPMVFRVWLPNAPMTTDRHGIPIPDTPATDAPDVLLLPLVAFDDAGYRLGYGGGYFDRTLAKLVPRPCNIGVGFELAHLDSVYPEPHDIRLDLIVTEAGIRDIGDKPCFTGRIGH